MMFDTPNNPLPGPSSAMIRINSGPAAGLRHRSIEDPCENGKRPRYNWYIQLASESSSFPSGEDTESSIYSMQGYETELVQEPSDTDTKSEQEYSSSSSSEDDVEVEYEVADLSNEENPLPGYGSSSGADDILATAGAIAAVICDSSLEAWLTDGEESDNSSVDDTVLTPTDFWTCIQCKSQNNNPLYRFCQKCFQVRKNLFPPRPKGHRKRKRKMEKFTKNNKKSVMQNISAPVSSHDSGLGSSQDLPLFDLDVASTSQEVAANVKNRKRKISTTDQEDEVSSDSARSEPSKRIRTEKNANVTVISDENNKLDSEVSKIDVQNKASDGQCNDNQQKSAGISEIESKTDTDAKCNGIEQKGFEFVKPEIGSNEQKNSKESVEEKPLSPLTEHKELCIMCNSASKNSVFLHGKSGHMCCCYKCAMRAWLTSKRCPVCNCKVNNVVKVHL